jgi:hypothetical protein
MNGFQLGGLAVAVGAVAWVVRATTARRIGRGVGVAWVLLWVSAATAIARPDLTVRAARLLGISRGADLVLYLSILGMIAGFFFVYLRMKRLETAITELVRRIAIGEDDGNGDAL